MKTSITKLDLKQRTKKRIVPTLLFSAVLPFIVCVCIPFEIFANNIEQFVFAVKDFMPLAILVSIVATAIMFFILLYLPEKGYKTVAAIYVSLALMFFIQGNYLNAGVRTLAGDGLGQKIPVTTEIFNLLLWIIVIAGAIFLAHFKKATDIISMVAVGLASVIMLSSFMSPLALAMTTKNVFKTKAERVSLNGESEFSILTTKNLTTLSSENNVFIFVVDVMDKEYVEEAFEDRPEIFENLDGFTYFSDNISIFGHTFPSVANMLTGASYDLYKERPDYLDSAYVNPAPLDIMNANNYQISLFTKGYYAYDDASCLPDYVSNVSEAERTEVIIPLPLATNFMQISLFRCFPLLFKTWVGDIDSGLFNTYLICQDAEGRDQYSTDLKRAWNYVQESKVNGEFTVIDDKNVFSLVHTYGCHSIEYDEEWDRPSGPDRKDITLSLMHSFNIIDEYIDAMKKAGVYENATILILGDHGIPKDNNSDLSDAMQTGLFIKPSGAGGIDGAGFTTTTSQVSHSQIWATIFDSENITLTQDQQTAFNQTTFAEFNPSGKSHFEIEEGVDVERHYFWHTYAGDCDQYKYLIVGDGENLENWKMIEHLHADKFIMN